MRKVTVEGVSETELLYALMPEFWGRGLAIEMARAIVALAGGTLALDQVIGFTLPSNLASRRVLERAGFQYQRVIIRAGLEHVLYRLRRA